MSTYVMSDIHGCYDEFIKMLETVSFGKDDHLILAGDYVDRGSQSYEMLRWLEHSGDNVTALRGNHDQGFLKYMEGVQEFVEMYFNGKFSAEKSEDMYKIYLAYKNMLASVSPSRKLFFDCFLSLQHAIRAGGCYFDLCRWIELIAKMDYYLKINVKGRDFLIVHAGYLEEGVKIPEGYDSREDFFVNAREEAYTVGGIRHGTVVAGHTPTIGRGEIVSNNGKVSRTYNPQTDCTYYDIDCGCCYRKDVPEARLACLRLDDEKIFYV